MTHKLKSIWYALHIIAMKNPGKRVCLDRKKMNLFILIQSYRISLYNEIKKWLFYLFPFSKLLRPRMECGTYNAASQLGKCNRSSDKKLRLIEK